MKGGPLLPTDGGKLEGPASSILFKEVGAGPDAMWDTGPYTQGRKSTFSPKPYLNTNIDVGNVNITT